MIRNPKYAIQLIAVILSFICSSCAPNVRTSLEIRINGFINENCYQAILQVEPDEGAMGLVAKRESAFLKAKTALLYDLAVENLANYCVDNRLKAGAIEKNKKNAEQAAYRNTLVEKIKGLASAGKIAFVYYNEKNSMVIGYRMFRIGFRKKLDDIINPPALQRNENSVPAARS